MTKIDRRKFVKQGTAGLVGATILPSFLTLNPEKVMALGDHSNAALHDYYERFGVTENMMREVMQEALSKGGRLLRPLLPAQHQQLHRAGRQIREPGLFPDHFRSGYPCAERRPDRLHLHRRSYAQGDEKCSPNRCQHRQLQQNHRPGFIR